MRVAICSLVAGIFLCPLAAPAESELGKALVEAAFSATERQIMERYFGGQQSLNEGKTHKQKKPSKGKKALPPGLAEKNKLPPGLAKRSVLPPGLKREALPDILVHDLPPIDERLDRIIVEGSVVLIEKATGKVLDIIEHIASTH